MGSTSAIPRSLSPFALALLAAGGLLVLSALVFLSPFALSPNAIQNDVYMGNLFLSPPLLVVGSALCVGSSLLARAQGRSLGWWQALLLAGVGGGLVALLYGSVGGHYSSV